MRHTMRATYLALLGLFGLVMLWQGAPGPGLLFAQDGETEEAASSESEDVAIRIRLTEAALPDGPTAAAWDEIPAAEFKLAPQVHWPERLLDATVKAIRVRGIHDSERVAVLLEYQDPTKDSDDAAALEFMVGDTRAHFAHGQEMLQVEGGPVNIWFWKHKVGKAVDMSAKGFKTLRPQEHQDVSASGEWRDGTWRVQFTRALETGHPDQDVQIVPGAWTNVAFAVWDGKMLASGDPKEKGSQKAVSSWWYIRAEPPSDYTVFIYVALGLGVAALFELALLKKLKKGQAA